MKNAVNKEALRNMLFDAHNYSINNGEDGKAVRDMYRKVIAAYEEAVAEVQDDLELVGDLAVCYWSISVYSKGAYKSEALEKAINLLSADVQNGPLWLKKLLAKYYYELGDTQIDLKDIEKAILSFKNSADLYETILSKDPTNELFRKSLMKSLQEMKWCFKHTGNKEGVIDTMKKIVAVFEEYYLISGGCKDAELGIVESYKNYIEELKDAKKLDLAIQQGGKLEDFLWKCVRARPHDAALQQALAKSYEDLGVNYVFVQDYNKAIEKMKEATVVYQKMVEQRPNDLDIQRKYIDTHIIIGRIFLGTRNFALALEEYKKAIKLTEGLVSKNPNNIELKISLAMQCNDIGSLIRMSGGDAAEAIQYMQKAVELQINVCNKEFDAGVSASRLAYINNLIDILVANNLDASDAVRLLSTLNTIIVMSALHEPIYDLVLQKSSSIHRVTFCYPANDRLMQFIDTRKSKWPSVMSIIYVNEAGKLDSRKNSLGTSLKILDVTENGVLNDEQKKFLEKCAAVSSSDYSKGLTLKDLMEVQCYAERQFVFPLYNPHTLICNAQKMMCTVVAFNKPLILGVKLPPELLERILSFLPVWELRMLNAVCKGI